MSMKKALLVALMLLAAPVAAEQILTLASGARYLGNQTGAHEFTTCSGNVFVIYPDYRVVNTPMKCT